MKYLYFLITEYEKNINNKIKHQRIKQEIAHYLIIIYFIRIKFTEWQIWWNSL